MDKQSPEPPSRLNMMNGMYRFQLAMVLGRFRLARAKRERGEGANGKDEWLGKRKGKDAFPPPLHTTAPSHPIPILRRHPAPRALGPQNSNPNNQAFDGICVRSVR